MWKKPIEHKPGQIPKEKEFVEVRPAIEKIPECHRSRIKTSWDQSRGKKLPEPPSSLGQHCKELNYLAVAASPMEEVDSESSELCGLWLVKPILSSDTWTAEQGSP